MSITLQRFANGDTNYVAKHNQNAGTIEGAIANLDAQVLAAAGAAVSAGSAFEALFGDLAAVVGKASYLPTTDGTDLEVAPGYYWRPSTATLTMTVGTTVLPFSGVAAGTYYLQVDATGTVTRSNEISEAVYSVAWTGSAFGTITRLAKIVFGAADWIAAQDSAALDDTFDALDDRLEAGEVKAVRGDLSRDYDTGQLSKSVAGSADVALTDTEANNAILRFTGELTGDIDVSVTLPSTPRIWLVRNDTTGSFTLTLKGASGTGEVVPQASVVWAWHDGTNITIIEVAEAGALGTASTLNFDTDGTLAANSDAKIATQKATKTYVDTKVAALVDSSPAALDTLNELAAALGDDENFAATVTAELANKAPLVQPFVVGMLFPGVPTASALVCLFAAPEGIDTLTFAAAIAGSSGKALTAATAQTDFDVRKNATSAVTGTSVGTMRFAAAGTVPTFIAASGFTLDGGVDTLSVWAPAAPDATLANISASFFCTR